MLKKPVGSIRKHSFPPSINRSHPLAVGLQNAWLLSEAGGSKVYDSIGSIDGSVTGAVRSLSKTGSALSFNGSGTDYVTMGSGNLLSATAPFTVVCLVTCTSVTSPSLYPHILKLQTSSGTAWELLMSSQSGYEGVALGGSATWATLKTNTGSAALNGIWNHIAVTYNGAAAGTGGNYSCYINGQLQTLAAAGAFGGISNATVLGSGIGTNLYFPGIIDYVLVYRRVLSAAEIREDYYRPYSYVNGDNYLWIVPGGAVTPPDVSTWYQQSNLPQFPKIEVEAY